MDDILAPLADDLGVRLVTSSGFQSISNVVKLLQRVKEMAKPTRIFYISDFDKKGRQMPIAVSRQIEFWLPDYAPGADIKLSPLVLTKAQIAQYKLPRSIDGDSTELDALEAIVPGELEKIVRQAVEPYLDPTVKDELKDAEAEAEETVEDEYSGLMHEHQVAIAALRKRVQLAAKKYQRQVDQIGKRLARDMAKFKKPLADLQAKVSAAAEEFQPDLPERPAQEASEQDEADWLFDSSRCGTPEKYFEQLSFYKAKQRADQGGTPPNEASRMREREKRQREARERDQQDRRRADLQKGE